MVNVSMNTNLYPKVWTLDIRELLNLADYATQKDYPGCSWYQIRLSLPGETDQSFLEGFLKPLEAHFIVPPSPTPYHDVETLYNDVYEQINETVYSNLYEEAIRLTAECEGMDRYARLDELTLMNKIGNLYKPFCEVWIMNFAISYVRMMMDLIGGELLPITVKYPQKYFDGGVMIKDVLLIAGGVQLVYTPYLNETNEVC